MKKATLHLISTALFVALSLPTAFAQEEEKEVRTIWDGVYNQAQADRGRNAYVASCSRCHRADLSGFEGSMDGKGFMRSWAEDTALSLYNRIQSTMPLGQPGSLADDTYVDIVAFFFNRNQFPMGEDELALASLDTIRIQEQAGPTEVPNFSLVQVVGCLVQDSSDVYKLTNSTQAVRVRDPEASTGEELATAKALPLGEGAYDLLRNVNYLDPQTMLGHKVEAKAFLIRNNAGERLNVGALATLSETCPE